MDFDWRTIFPVASLFVALIALGFSAYTFRVQRRDKQPRLKVIAREDLAVTTRMRGTFLLGVGMKRDETGKPAGAGEPVICLEVANVGEKTVRVVEVKLVQPSGAYMRLGSMGAEQPFPPKVEPGDSTRCWIGLGEVTDIVKAGGASGRTQLTFEVKDALGYVHRGTITVDTDEWVSYSTFFSERAD